MLVRLLAAASLSVLGSHGALAQDDTEALVTFQVMKPHIALRMATVAMETCQEEGFQVGVAVVDRFGLPQVFIRDQFAGAHVHETAIRKAWTAVSFRTDTLALDDISQPGNRTDALRDIPGVLTLGGGVPVEAAGSIVGGIGVSGAPSPELDDTCARAGIAAVEDDIAF